MSLQSEIVMPMFLAVPATILIAGSIVLQFKSGSLVSAISCTGHAVSMAYGMQEATNIEAQHVGARHTCSEESVPFHAW